MKKYFVVSDVHSFYDQMVEALNNAGFDYNNPDHILISCGDLLDRGPSPIQCLDFVNGLPDDRKILITGNHEDLLRLCIDLSKLEEHDYHNGTAMTMYQLATQSQSKDGKINTGEMFDLAKKNKKIKEYFDKLVDYAEIEDYIFVHGWIPCYASTFKGRHTYSFDPEWRSGNWIIARWTNGMEAWHSGVVVRGKTIVCGHWHCSFGNSKYHNDGMEFPNRYSTNPEHRRANFNPFIDNGIVALDACTVYSKKINVFTFER